MPLEKLGPYRLERLLGRGGMGAVYAGVHETTSQRAAIKLLPPHLADDESFRERFKQEIETLKRLLHPHIVQLHGYGEEDGNLYYVMELIEGRSLQDELASGRRFGWRETVRAGVAIALALKHAHDRGIIHRDLKPANLLIDAQDHIKLTDFGIAKLYGGASVTMEGGVLGTADYMSPEQANGEAVTNRCDLYSLGSVLYALLTGRPPFAGKSVTAVVAALQKEKPVPPRRLAPDTPAEFEQLILQLLEKDPQNRIPTALAVANRLRAMEHGLSLETQIETGGNEAEKPAAKHRPGLTDRTELIDSSSQATSAMHSAEEYRLASEPTEVADESASNSKSSRTALKTQAGKKTGAGSDSGRGTHAERGGTNAGSEADDLAARASRFVMVSEQELRGRVERDESPFVQWVVAGVLAVFGITVAAGAVYMAVSEPSADRLFARIERAAERGEPSELAGVENELASFLKRFPGDERAAQVKSLDEKLTQYRLEKKAANQLRRGSLERQASPIERAYNEALALAATDPEAALAQFDAIVAVFDGDPKIAKQEEDATWLKLAHQQSQRLSPLVIQLAQEQQTAVRRQLSRADELSEKDPAAAERIWRGIESLYRHKSWARELVAQAQQRLSVGQSAPHNEPTQ